MCKEWIMNLFKKKEDEKELCLTHPEENKNDSQTVENTNVNFFLLKWLESYKVPREYYDIWINQIKITIYDKWPPEVLALGIHPGTPAYATSEGNNRILCCLAPWFNPGVIAHEQAHNCYFFLTEQEKANFAIDYLKVKNDRLIQYLYSQNSYGLSSDIEAHAELYRYLAERMPDSLKKYYPKLLET